MSHDITLHQWEISPFCQKVARSLRHKGLNYRTIDYNGLRGAKVMRLSKVGKVPVLDIDEQRIQDSTRIARWLDEHYPEPLLYPADTSQRAQAELWEDFADELLYWYEVHFRVSDPEAMKIVVDLSCEGRPAFERVGAKTVLAFGLRQQLKFQGLGKMSPNDIRDEFLRILDRIEIALEATSWLAGDAMSIADISVGSQLLEIDRTSGPIRSELWKRPRLAALLKEVKAL
ncbi:glutathione S-transferase [Oleiphilus messinensis]|uniref:Glutathione S-transferase n=1 Tax=Oleiphilus messinensis TaxID=141451 RepID=A0A1Y0I303_9GAMM|nr:glutathione S-transferase family protein [Oleiphilus messinensis]ARU54589.1 glutathione S-transferase [Oleiphilus messinensis]